MKTKETLQEKIVRVARHVNFRHYRSQPLPESYSIPRRYAVGNPQPSIMQQAFINAIN